MDIQQLHVDDIPSVSRLIGVAFTKAVAPTLTEEGIANFESGITPESIKARLLSGNIFAICKNIDTNTIVGIGEIRNINHLNLLFVDPCMQGKGIGRKLLDSLVSGIKDKEITVNSSLNAVSIYKRFGFEESSERNEINGIKFQPMVCTIQPKRVV